MTAEQEAAIAADMAKVQEDAEATFGAMADAFSAWIKTKPDGAVTMAGTTAGLAKLAALLLTRMEDETQRGAAASTVIATVLLNAGVDVEQAVCVALNALGKHTLAGAEVRGHA